MVRACMRCWACVALRLTHPLAQIKQEKASTGPTQKRSKIFPAGHLSSLKVLKLRNVVTLSCLRNIVVAAPKLVELEFVTEEENPGLWTEVAETLATTAAHTLRVVRLEKSHELHGASMVSQDSCNALSRIRGLTAGPVVTGNGCSG